MKTFIYRVKGNEGDIQISPELNEMDIAMILKVLLELISENNDLSFKKVVHILNEITEEPVLVELAKCIGCELVLNAKRKVEEKNTHKDPKSLS